MNFFFLKINEVPFIQKKKKKTLESTRNQKKKGAVGEHPPSTLYNLKQLKQKELKNRQPYYPLS